MKPAREWDEEYVLNSIPTIEVNDYEVKGRKAIDLTAGCNEQELRNTLSKAVSAFANSGGGTLIFGLKNSPLGAAQWIVDDGGVDLSFKKPNTREWLEDVIPTAVDGHLTDFNVYVINNGTQIQSGRGLIIVDIADSRQAPHQANDNKYYVRVGGKSRPAPHRIVLDILNRRRDPVIEISTSIETNRFLRNKYSNMPFSPLTSREEKVEAASRKLTIMAVNQGSVLAHHVNVFCYVPLDLVSQEESRHRAIGEFEEAQYCQFKFENTRRDIVDVKNEGFSFTTKKGPSWFDPILPGLRHSWTVNLDPEKDLSRYSENIIRWRAHADNAGLREGQIFIKDIQETLHDSRKEKSKSEA